jgi:hypothetical protein
LLVGQSLICALAVSAEASGLKLELEGGWLWWCLLEDGWIFVQLVGETEKARWWTRRLASCVNGRLSTSRKWSVIHILTQFDRINFLSYLGKECVRLDSCCPISCMLCKMWMAWYDNKNAPILFSPFLSPPQLERSSVKRIRPCESNSSTRKADQVSPSNEQSISTISHVCQHPIGLSIWSSFHVSTLMNHRGSEALCSSSVLGSKLMFIVFSELPEKR